MLISKRSRNSRKEGKRWAELEGVSTYPVFHVSWWVEGVFENILDRKQEGIAKSTVSTG